MYLYTSIKLIHLSIMIVTIVSINDFDFCASLAQAKSHAVIISSCISSVSSLPSTQAPSPMDSGLHPISHLDTLLFDNSRGK